MKLLTYSSKKVKRDRSNVSNRCVVMHNKPDRQVLSSGAVGHAGALGNMSSNLACMMMF